MTTLYAQNIQWDVDSKNELEGLPTSIEIPEEISKADSIYLDKISDYLSDETGFCHKGFTINLKVETIITPQTTSNALKVLIDNGIDEDEAENVLQAIGYALLDAELFPEIED